MDTIVVEFAGGTRCPVHFIRHDDDVQAAWDPAWQDVALIADENVMRLHGGAFVEGLRGRARRVLPLSFPAGEDHKTRDTKAMLEDAMLAERFSRRSVVVALGGGIALDVAGFVAATYMRGIPYVSVPTSLVAQVDASVGGKTAVNTPRGKNLVGAFHQPSAVLVDTRYLRTLPEVEWRNGLAETVKHAVIADDAFFRWLEDNAPALATPDAVPVHAVRRCVEIKGAIVSQDEREGGLRAVLNFGHTVGHAVESACRFEIGHGRAVARGMLVEGEIARRLCGFPADDLARLRRLLDGWGVVPPAALAFDALRPFLDADKKNRDGEVHVALPARIGAMSVVDGAHTRAVPVSLVKEAWDAVP